MSQTAQAPSLFESTPVAFYQGERDAFARPEPLTPSQWAERKVWLPEGKTAYPGPWRNEITPYLPEVMDTWAQPWVREVVLCFSEQTGKSTVAYLCLLYAADRDPGPALMVLPDENMAGRVNEKRIQSLITAGSQTRKLVADGAHAMSKLQISFKTGMDLFMGWSNSPSVLSAFPVRYLFLDEEDKFPAFSGRETDPVRLSKKRLRTYKNLGLSKVLMTSTVTTEHKYIWPALTQEAREIRRYQVRCPECGDYQVMETANLKWPKEERDPKRIRDERLARYQCEECRALWDDYARDQAVAAGRWRPYRWADEKFQAMEPVERPSVVGFHLPAYCSRMVSLSEAAAQFLEAQGDKRALMDFKNSIEAMPFKDWSQDRQEDQVLKLCDDRDRGEVPAEADILLATADAQKEGLWYKVRAWQYGPDMNSWLVREGFVETWAALEKVFFTDRYVDRNGTDYRIAFGFVDSGDGNRTREVYNWCDAHPPFKPCKGRDTQKDPISPSKLKGYEGLFLYNILVSTFKDALARKLKIGFADPGFFRLHKETSQAYAAHMCAEYVDEKGRWVCPNHKDNHLWDCEVYGFAAAEFQGVAFRQRKPPPKPRPADNQTTPNNQPPQRRTPW